MEPSQKETQGGRDEKPARMSRLLAWAAGEIERPTFALPTPREGESLQAWKTRAAEDLLALADQLEAFSKQALSPAGLWRSAKGVGRGALAGYALTAGLYRMVGDEEHFDQEVEPALERGVWGWNAADATARLRKKNEREDRALADESLSAPSEQMDKPNKFVEMGKLALGVALAIPAAPLGWGGLVGGESAARRKAFAWAAQGMRRAAQMMGPQDLGAGWSEAARPSDGRALAGWLSACEWARACNARWSASPAAAALEGLALGACEGAPGLIPCMDAGWQSHNLVEFDDHRSDLEAKLSNAGGSRNSMFQAVTAAAALATSRREIRGDFSDEAGQDLRVLAALARWWRSSQGPGELWQGLDGGLAKNVGLLCIQDQRDQAPPSSTDQAAERVACWGERAGKTSREQDWPLSMRKAVGKRLVAWAARSWWPRLREELGKRDLVERSPVAVDCDLEAAAIARAGPALWTAVAGLGLDSEDLAVAFRQGCQESAEGHLDWRGSVDVAAQAFAQARADGEEAKLRALAGGGVKARAARL